MRVIPKRTILARHARRRQTLRHSSDDDQDLLFTLVPEKSPIDAAGMRHTPLGGLSPRAFLRRHWQKRPLLVRGAFPRFRDPVTPARLLALARRPGIESRLVLERGGAHPWQVVPG